MSVTKSTLGYALQLGGAGSLIVGAVLGVHHAAIAATLLCGAAAVYVGAKIRGASL
jgi:hypothetical protein